jgi:hypothetical protein
VPSAGRSVVKPSAPVADPALRRLGRKIPFTYHSRNRVANIQRRARSKLGGHICRRCRCFAIGIVWLFVAVNFALVSGILAQVL